MLRRATNERARVLNLLNLKTHREHFIRVRFSHLRVFLANFQLYWTCFFETLFVLAVWWCFGPFF